MSVPQEYRVPLENRIREQILAEIHGKPAEMYEFTLPQIRERRETERSDEPELTLRSLSEFSSKVVSAKIISIKFREFHPYSEIYGDDPVVRVETVVRYNEKVDSTFSTLWVLMNRKWYSTALGKSWR